MKKEEYWEKIEYNLDDIGMRLDVAKSVANLIYQHIDEQSKDVANSFDLLMRELRRIYNRHEVLTKMMIRYKDMTDNE